MGSELFVDDARVLVERKRSLSSRMRSISLFLVSENCVAMTTRHRLIMKKEPICGKWKGKVNVLSRAAGCMRNSY